MNPQSTATAKKRSLSIDFLKLFAIFLVIWGHALADLRDIDMHDLLAWRIIYSFHMPLFMALVGFFSASSMNLTWKELLVKKFKQLLLPALSFGLIVCGIWLYLGSPVSYFEILWFLKCAFLCYILLYASLHIFKNRTFAFFIALFVSQGILEFQLNTMFPCFILGYFLRSNLGLLRRYNTPALIISLVCFVTALFFFDRDTFFKPTRGDIIRALPDLSVAATYVAKHSLMLFTGFSGTVFFLTLFDTLGIHLKRTPIGEYIGSFGSMTLGVYLIQTLYLEIILFRLCSFNSMDFTIYQFVFTPAVSMVILILCLITVSLMKRSSLLSRLFLGK